MSTATEQILPSPLSFLEAVSDFRDSPYLVELETKYHPGDVPYQENVDFAEVVITPHLTRARSFRADMMHKLNIIFRAYGSLRESAYRLHKDRSRVNDWYAMRDIPRSRADFDKIDRVYETACERLQLEFNKKQRAKKANKRNPKTI